MTASDTMRRVGAGGVIGIVRAPVEGVAESQARRAVEAGLDVVEVSLTTPDALAVIANLAGGKAVVGAGTVLDRAAAEAVIAAGAAIIVCPTLEPEVIEVAVRHDVAVVPGCLTPTEMTTAMKLGASAVKIFPAHLWTPAALAGVLQALPGLRTVPTGGVGPSDAADWIRAGAFAVGVGSALTAADDPAPVVQALAASIRAAR